MNNRVGQTLMSMLLGVAAFVCVGPAGSLWAAQAFQESSGQVVIETEHYSANIPRSGKTWTLETATAGFSSAGYLTALPNTGTATDIGYAASCPEQQFYVKFSTIGTYYIWVRGVAPTGNDDSIHAGVDTTALTSADRISSSAFLSGFNWTRDTLDASPATITISTAGIHVIHIWMREDGFKLDKLLLRTNSSSTAPTGTGPVESTRLTISDTTAPPTPSQPKEGSLIADSDYDDDGAYTVYWGTVADSGSGVGLYELQERVGLTGVWTALSSNVTTGSYDVSGRADKTTYYYRVRAQNGAGLWSGWSAETDGITVDTTTPTTPVVTDDGSTTVSTTQLHASWTASSDPDSGVTDYEYLIRQDSITGAILINYTSAGLTTQVTKTGLSLVSGKMYYIGVRSKNGSLLYSATAYSDGILVDATPPTGTVSINSGAASTNAVTVTLTLSATDNAGAVSQMKFSNDNLVYSTPQAYSAMASWILTVGDGTKTVYAKFSDGAGNWSAATTKTIMLDTLPPQVDFTAPLDGAVIIAQ